MRPEYGGGRGAVRRQTIRWRERPVPGGTVCCGQLRFHPVSTVILAAGWAGWFPPVTDGETDAPRTEMTLP